MSRMEFLKITGSTLTGLALSDLIMLTKKT